MSRKKKQAKKKKATKDQIVLQFVLNAFAGWIACAIGCTVTTLIAAAAVGLGGYSIGGAISIIAGIILSAIFFRKEKSLIIIAIAGVAVGIIFGIIITVATLNGWVS